MSDLAIRVDGLSKQYRIGSKQQGYKTLRDTLAATLLSPFRRAQDLLRGQAYGAAELGETIWALKDVSCEIKRGEVVGIIGPNGAGKTTLLKILSRITEPTEGQAEIQGRVGSLLEVGTGFHPELTGRENIYLNGAILGMKKAEIEQKFDEMVSFAEIDKFIDTPVKHYSSGMYVRLAFAVAAHLEPEILLVDEVLAVGDMAFQKKCLGKMDDVAKEGRTVLFVSHNMGAIQQLTERSILLENGKLILDAKTPKVVEVYLDETVASETTTNLETKREDFKVNSIRFNYDVLESGFNKPLQFDLSLSVERDKYDVLFGIAIVNSIGAKIMVSECVVKKLSSSEISLSIIINNHYLPPGSYIINLGIEVRGELILYQERVLRFELSDLNIDNPTLVQKRDKIGSYIPSEYIIN
ncbi:MAG: ABC transporter ATP-binding protein [Syntrophobacterales bacterium]|jgi:lipopolysaccharide transport system ATP-binding protein